MDEKEEDKSEESKQNHIIYYKSLSKIISNMEKEIQVIDKILKNVIRF